MIWDKIKAVRDRMRNLEESSFCSMVIVAAGSSQRMGSDKILASLSDMPVLARTLTVFQNCDMVDEIVVVTRAEILEQVADLCKNYDFGKVTKVLLGGKTRTESALAGVSAVSTKASLIGIHDGARPLVTNDLIERTILAAREHQSAVPVIPSTDTLKLVEEDGFVSGTLDRSRVFRVQTPQVFSAVLIKGALSNAVAKDISLTDDSTAMEAMNVKTFTVPGDTENLKLTSPEDMAVAESILRRRREQA